MEALVYLDGLLAALPPSVRALLWGTLTAMVSMGIYAKIAPQDKLRELKAAHKEHKKKMKGYDGDFEGLSVLIKQDLGFSLKLIAASVVPFVASMAPVILLMVGLEDIYANTTFPTMGAEWTGCFEFWFLLAAIVVSLAIKVIFKIA